MVQPIFNCLSLLLKTRIMQIIRTSREGRFFVDQAREKGKRVGFVPTMGALHAGHISLIERAKKEQDLVIASIFVNPTQFNDPKDLQTYPKTPDNDRKQLEEAGCDMLFEPDSQEEVYIPSYKPPNFDFGPLEKAMEGKIRPGHFKGVAMVVYRLFEIIPAHHAYFGEKDFQQLAIIRKMRDDFQLPINITGCETIRESDGLAMSSRNIRLTTDERGHAGIIYKTLKNSVEILKAMGFDAGKRLMVNQIEASRHFKVEYLEFADPTTLQSHSSFDENIPTRVFIAVKTSSTRLIDNMQLC